MVQKIIREIMVIELKNNRLRIDFSLVPKIQLCYSYVSFLKYDVSFR